ncbi:MAG: phenylacetate-CoA oxygenase subunit PaaI [Crocinitomicaceae bacterium]|nr:phenylacetate-CoA oxygenase subunit PaaI [Crocinitomicaceae bacterium]|tara:strand:- start:206 stop:949 length:744 start_codon:yes stop_codon:yes gene_type:complete
MDALLRLGDDALVLAQRLGEWCGHAPALEEDIALTNIALDLIGQTQSYLSLAGSLDPVAPKTDDELAFLRSENEFKNLLLVEQPNGHFGDTIARQFLFDTYALLRAEHIAQQTFDLDAAAIAAKAVKEIRYHADHSSKWIIRLGDGTSESHTRIQKSINDLWGFTGEMFAADEVDNAGAIAGLLPDLSALKTQWDVEIDSVLSEATLMRPKDGAMKTGGRTGIHTKELGIMLAEMQILPRTHPGASW